MAEEIFGRDEELAHIGAFIDAVPNGFRALLLDGDPGIGKSTVWRWGRERAANLSHHVLSCRPGERESELSYAALGDLLSGIDEATLPSLPGPQHRALAGALVRNDVTDPVIDPRALAYAFMTTLRLLAKSAPVLIAIDDAHWLDAPSARLLRFALRRLEAEPVGVLVLSRIVENATEPLDLGRTLAPTRVNWQRLKPLTVGAIHHIIRSQLGIVFSRSVLLQVHQVSQGNPFFALEIARSLQARGLDHEADLRLPIPATLMDSVRGRLTSVSKRSQEVLLIAAALSQPTVSLVTAAAEHPEHVGRALDEAAEAGIIEITDDRVRFTHPLLAAAHYDAASETRRRTLHKRLATIVTDVEERAGHLAQGSTASDSDVAWALDRACRSARARGAPEVAAKLAEQARRRTPSDQTEDWWRRTNEAAMCLYLSGQSGQARKLWEQIVENARPGPLRASARWHMVEFRDSILDANTRIEAAKAALEEAGSDLALRASINFTIATHLVFEGRVDGARPYARDAVRLAERQGDPMALALALQAAAWVEFFGGRGMPEALIDRALALEVRVRHLPLEDQPRMFWALMLAFIGEDVASARRELLLLRGVAAESGYEVSLPILLYVMSELECRAGDWEKAERYAAECYEAAIQNDQEFRIPLALCAQAMLAARRGHLDVARNLAEQAHSVVSRTGPWYSIARVCAVLGFIECSDGRPDAAHRILGPVIECEQVGGCAEPASLHCLGDEIEALIGLRNFAAADTMIELLDSQGHQLNRAWALATALRCRGLLAAARGDLTRARGALDQALVEHKRLPDPFELARTLLVLGNVCRRARQKRPARDYLERAATIFADLGAGMGADRASNELRRVGAFSIGPDQLSSTEERVARLVATGHTNKEIAHALFISVKSVEANLTRIYSKIGVRSRTELALHFSGDRSTKTN